METKPFMALHVLQVLDAVDLAVLGGLVALVLLPAWHGGRLDERWVRRRIAWLRRATAAGALVGLVIGAWFGGLVMFTEAVFTRLIAGPLVVAALARAGAALLQSRQGTGVVADLRPRTLDRYRERWVRGAMFVAAAAVLLAIVIRAVLPEAGASAIPVAWQPTRTGYAVLGLLALCVAALIELATVAVARRSHPADTSATLETLEGFRRRTVNSVSLFGAAALFVAAAGLTSGLATFSGARPAVWAFTGCAWVLFAVGWASAVAGLLWRPRRLASDREAVLACT